LINKRGKSRIDAHFIQQVLKVQSSPLVTVCTSGASSYFDFLTNSTNS